MRGLALLGIVFVAACNAQAFACDGDGDCMLGGEPGVCVSGNCAYPDGACASGYRYPVGLGSGLAGECVPGDGVDGSDTDVGSGSSSGAASTSVGSSSPSTSTTVDPPGDDTTSTSTGEELDRTSTESSSTSTGNADGPISVTGVTSASSSTGVQCTDLACGDCMRCVDGEGEACHDVASVCFNLVGCPEASGCMETCVVTGECMTDCCAGLDMQTASAALDLHQCRVDACAQLCEVIDPVCN